MKATHMTKAAAVFGLVSQVDVRVSQRPTTHGQPSPAWHVGGPGGFGFAAATYLAAEHIPTDVHTALGTDHTATVISDSLGQAGVNLRASRAPDRPSLLTRVVIEDGRPHIRRTAGSAAETWPDKKHLDDIFEHSDYCWCALGPMISDVNGNKSRHVIQAAHRAGCEVSWTPGSDQVRATANMFLDELPLIRLLVTDWTDGAAFCQVSPDSSVTGLVKSLAAYAGNNTIVVVAGDQTHPTVCHDAAGGLFYALSPFTDPLVTPQAARYVIHATIAAGLIKGVNLLMALEQAYQNASSICAFWNLHAHHWQDSQAASPRAVSCSLSN
jgi:sugar/nucleoside kinase (ribokinase family)